MVIQEHIRIATQKRGTYNIQSTIEELIQKHPIQTGICNLFLQHTSASLILCENADPTVRHDLETFMARIAPDGDPTFLHQDEGPDDMPAHIRSIITQNDLSLPISQGKLNLGTWQDIFLWEHRTHPHTRQIIITLYGE